RLEAARRAQGRPPALELPDPILSARALAPDGVQPIGEMHLLDPDADDREGAGHEERRGGENHDQRASHARVRVAMKPLVLLHASRSSTRSFALLARGFARTSSSVGCRGDGSSAANPAGSRARNVCFTMRSSPEWNEMTPSRPPAARTAGACASAWRSAPGSSWAPIRSAGNVRVAT